MKCHREVLSLGSNVFVAQNLYDKIYIFLPDISFQISTKIVFSTDDWFAVAENMFKVREREREESTQDHSMIDLGIVS